MLHSGTVAARLGIRTSDNRAIAENGSKSTASSFELGDVGLEINPKRL